MKTATKSTRTKPFAETLCDWCEEPVLPGNEPGIPIMGTKLHRECALRTVAGSAGHILKMCSCFGGVLEDPPGLSKRDQARAAFRVWKLRDELFPT